MDAKIPLPERYCVVYNEHSGPTAFSNIRAQLTNLLRPYPGAQLLPVADLENLTTILDGSVRLIIAGGDGTIHQVAHWLWQRKKLQPFGILPTGSGNILARSLSLPTALPQALQRARTGTPQPIDAFVINKERLGIIAASLGAHATLLQKTTRPWKSTLGIAAYWLQLAPQLFPLPRYQFTFTADSGATLCATAATAIIANTLAAFPVEPFRSVSPNDGQLHLFLLHHKRKREFAADVWELLKGNGRLQHVTHYAARQFTLDPANTIPSAVDGEFLETPITDIRVLPGALSIIL